MSTTTNEFSPEQRTTCNCSVCQFVNTLAEDKRDLLQGLGYDTFKHLSLAMVEGNNAIRLVNRSVQGAAAPPVTADDLLAVLDIAKAYCNNPTLRPYLERVLAGEQI